MLFSYEIEIPFGTCRFFLETVVARRSHTFTATVRKAKALPLLRPLETKVTIPTFNDVFITVEEEFPTKFTHS